MTDTFAEANDIEVRNDGHLHVLGDNGTVAIYAPGKWSNAKVQD
ncbi:hypothetical protein [Micromonospora rubida]